MDTAFVFTDYTLMFKFIVVMIPCITYNMIVFLDPDVKATLRSLCEDLDIPFQDKMLRYAKAFSVENLK